MPDQHPHENYRRPRPPDKPRRRSPSAIRYAELHCYTNFSFLHGASHPDELVHRAIELGHHALAITDRHSLAGVVRAHKAAKEVGLKLLIGAEVAPQDGPPLVLLATDRKAYGRLADLLSTGKLRAPKGECHLTVNDIAERAEGLLAGVIANSRSWIRQNSALPTESHLNSGEFSYENCSWIRQNSALPTESHLNSGEFSYELPATLRLYRDIFGDRCYALAELHRGPDDTARLAEMKELARQANLPLAAANGVHYHSAKRQFLHNVLTAVRQKCTVAELDHREFPNAQRHLKSPEEMHYLFADCPEAVARTVEIADRCHFSLDELRYEYPRELCPPEMTPLQYLRQLTEAGAKARYPDGVPAKVRTTIEHEMQLIEELHYEAYFLTVWDLVRFARSRDILCQGRGSAANSAVCYCLGVTSVDPERIDVLFERFVSKERDEAPDIDIDFEHERREEVLQYIYDKYGRDRTGMTAEVICYRIRSAVREVSKALGLSLDQADSLAKAQEHFFEDDQLANRFREAGLDPQSRAGKQLAYLIREILGFPRHLSQHVGGMVMTEGLLRELVPIENAAMPGRTVVEWDKDDLDTLGILKVDCLGLGMLTAIRKCFDLIHNHYGKRYTLATVPAEDPEVYKMIQQADTVGVFQIESRGQMSMLPRLRPNCFYDLVIEVAIVRPGPIQGNMVHPYLRRRNGLEPVEFPSESVRQVLEKTLGVPLFQEQAMRLAVVAAGFTPGEADQLRRAMGAWRKHGAIETFRQKLIDGMLANGYESDFAERVFKQISGFGEYGFPESHAASFALLVYVSAWLKRYYPAVFTAGILNSQPMGFYQPAQLVADARKHGVEVRPVDVSFSEWDCTLVDAERGARFRSCHDAGKIGILPHDTGKIGILPHDVKPQAALRLGMRMVRGLSQENAEKIVRCRVRGQRSFSRNANGMRSPRTPLALRLNDRVFSDFEDFAHRTKLSSAVLTQLANADAFGSLTLDRRAALWRSLEPRTEAPLFDGCEQDEPEVTLPPLPANADVLHDYLSVGLSLKGHPVQFLRDVLEEMGVVPASSLDKLENGKWLKVAGIVLLRQRPSTAKGITFVTIEDETGFANLVIRPQIWEQYHAIARNAAGMIVQGRLQREGQVIHVVAQRLEDLSAKLANVSVRSRDFR